MTRIITQVISRLLQIERGIAPRPEPMPPAEGERLAFGRLLTFSDLVFAVTMCALVFGLMRDVSSLYTDTRPRDHVLMSVDTADLPGQEADVIFRSSGQDVRTLHLNDSYGGYLDVVARRTAPIVERHLNLLQMLPALVKYALAFCFFGLFWAMHRQMFQWVQRASSALVVFNLVFLLCIVINPFTTFFWSWKGVDDPDALTWFWSDRQGTMVYILSLAGAAAALLLTWVAAMLSRGNMHRGVEAVRWYYTLRQVLLVAVLLGVFRLASVDVIMGNIGLVAVLLGSVMLGGWVRHLAGWVAALWGWLSVRLLLAVNPRAARYRQF